MIDNELIKIIDQFDKIYSKHSGIGDFMRNQKLSILKNSTYNILFPVEDEMFSEFDMPPSEMNFEIQSIPNATWDNLLGYTSSLVNVSASGKNIKLAIKETTTNKFVGFIRIASPIINCKPRNDMFGKAFTSSPELASSFNNCVMMGFVIVPIQPFGFNYLGGKLLAGICCSHEIREIFNKKYNTNICLFETTSLYGSSKSMSQYDGMEPYIRYKGLTESKFIPVPSGDDYDELKAVVDSIDNTIIVREGTSKKLKSLNNIIRFVNKNIIDLNQKKRFNDIVEKALSLTERKRYYVSNYGYKNSIEYILGDNDKLIPNVNYDRFHLENIIAWWKNKAKKRYDNLVERGDLRTKVEIQTANDLDIIR